MHINTDLYKKTVIILKNSGLKTQKYATIIFFVYQRLPNLNYYKHHPLSQHKKKTKKTLTFKKHIVYFININFINNNISYIKTKHLTKK